MLNVIESTVLNYSDDLMKLYIFQWFIGNYSYQAALSHTEAGIVNVMSSSSSLFTLLLAACLPSGISDRFTITKFVAVLISIAGVVSIIIQLVSKFLTFCC